MQKFVFFIPLLWIFVFLLQKKIHKFLFLTAVDAVILAALFISQTNHTLTILLLMFIVNFLTLLLPDEDIGFEKKDILFFISLIFVLPVIGFIKKYKNVFFVQLTITEQLQFVLLFFLFAITCFFVLKEMHSKMDEKK